MRERPIIWNDRLFLIFSGWIILYIFPWTQQLQARQIKGAQLTVRSLTGATKGQVDTRSTRLIALYVPASQSPTPFLSPGRFRAIWTASLRLKLRGEYQLSVAGRGKVKVSIKEKIVLEGEGEDLSKLQSRLLSLSKRNDLTVEYESPEKGDAWIRLYWSSKQFRPEPIPMTALRHDSDADELVHGKQLRTGRELMVNSRCLKCHQADTEAWIKAKGMPELEMDAPALKDIGSRLHQSWLAQWIQNPKKLRPTATMPQLFHGDKSDLQIRDIAAYLSSLRSKSKAEGWETNKTASQEGQRLFGELGCIACHTPPTAEFTEEDDFDRISLRDVVAKWKPHALMEFLQQPDRHYQWIRMPNFHLSAKEAHQLATYLTSIEKRKVFTTQLGSGNIERGKKLTVESGCLNCHQIDNQLSSTLKAPELRSLTKERWQQGCMADEQEKRKTAPLYSLDEDQKLALQAITLDGIESFKRRVPLEYATRRVENLRCIACHTRDGEFDYWTELETDVDDLLSKLPPPEKKPEGLAMLQTRPLLTWVGEKLHPKWMTELFADKLTHKPRPFLRARMPAFPKDGELLSHGLATQHGFSPTSEPDKVSNPKLAAVGKSLTDATKWNCTGCHDVGNQKATGVFEAPGVNFSIVRERLRRHYFERWLWAPTRIWPGTKMPQVYQWGMKSQLKDVLDGDSSKQIEALWQYLLQGKNIR